MPSLDMLSSLDLQDYLEKHKISGDLKPMDASTETVVKAAVALNISHLQIIKSILFMINEEPVLIISAGTSHINKKLVRKIFGMSKRKVRPAKTDEVLEITGYLIGTVPPLGHKTKLKTIIDPSVMECHTVFGGGGDLMTMLGIESKVLLDHTKAEIINVSK